MPIARRKMTPYDWECHQKEAHGIRKEKFPVVRRVHSREKYAPSSLIFSWYPKDKSKQELSSCLKNTIYIFLERLSWRELTLYSYKFNRNDISPLC